MLEKVVEEMAYQEVDVVLVEMCKKHVEEIID